MFDISGVISGIPERIRNSLSDPNLKVGIRNQNGEPAELLLTGTVGDDWDGVTADEVVDFLSGNADREVLLRVNSPGGLVFDGLQIYNALSKHKPQVKAVIEGLAFSAASFIPMAADTVSMHEASHFGIHRAMALVLGNVTDMRDAIEWLSRIDDTLVNIYTAKTGATSEEMNQWLDGEKDGTLFSASEALDAGFVDEVISVKHTQPAAEETRRVGGQAAWKAKVAAMRLREKSLTR